MGEQVTPTRLRYLTTATPSQLGARQGAVQLMGSTLNTTVLCTLFIAHCHALDCVVQRAPREPLRLVRYFCRLEA